MQAKKGETGTIDRVYLEKEEHFLTHYKACKKLHRSLLQTLDASRALSQAVGITSEALTGYYDQAPNKPKDAVGKVAKATDNTEKSRIEYEDAMRKKVIEPMTLYLQALKLLKDYRKDRELAVSELDYYKSKMKSLREKPPGDVTVIPRNESKMHQAEDLYKKMNEELIKAWTQVNEEKYIFFNPMLQFWMKGETAFREGALKTIQTVSKVVEAPSENGLDVATKPKFDSQSIIRQLGEETNGTGASGGNKKGIRRSASKALEIKGGAPRADDVDRSSPLSEEAQQEEEKKAEDNAESWAVFGQLQIQPGHPSASPLPLVPTSNGTPHSAVGGGALDDLLGFGTAAPTQAVAPSAWMPSPTGQQQQQQQNAWGFDNSNNNNNSVMQPMTSTSLRQGSISVAPTANPFDQAHNNNNNPFGGPPQQPTDPWGAAPTSINTSNHFVPPQSNTAMSFATSNHFTSMQQPLTNDLLSSMQGGVPAPSMIGFPTVQSAPRHEQCQVLYPYTAADDSELTLKKGDVVTVLAREGGWWTGISPEGRQGIFPGNYVKLL
eukprot:CAMPEP_0184667430 /NCGR_PEP_ID=MMETSP0308-20130426/67251_1 /TAXON_ID=38269 /ORGANISM="Gloeochaete witrockiana, Strain SAG 46.84" /LENGTH=549 /DNA_ID=CAMNT_0027112629 /DNA_START=154 /DNA_END=1803 /DNA_ORIENTATION=-